VINARATEATADAVPESGTRERVLRAISQQGPITAALLAERLGLSDTAIRRHVDNLADAGLIEPHEAASPRRRGRPAKAYVVSDAGHRSLTSGYHHLAGQACAISRRPSARTPSRTLRGDGSPKLGEGYAAQLADPHGHRRARRTARQSIEDLNPGLKDLGRYEYGWADPDDAGATARRGLNERSSATSRPQERARVDARSCG
jgi:predicted ArsR family transcriptional regulator